MSTGGRARARRVKVLRLPHAAGLPLPAYQSAGAAGLDLVAAVEAPVVLRPGQRALVATGLVLELPPGLEAQVRPRSGLALRHGITVLNSPGTIDSDYRGEVGVLLVNLGDRPFTVARGERIAQLVVTRCERVMLVEARAASATRRGSGGFGSTGRGGGRGGRGSRRQPSLPPLLAGGRPISLAVLLHQLQGALGQFVDHRALVVEERQGRQVERNGGRLECIHGAGDPPCEFSSDIRLSGRHLRFFGDCGAYRSSDFSYELLSRPPRFLPKFPLFLPKRPSRLALPYTLRPKWNASLQSGFRT